VPILGANNVSVIAKINPIIGNIRRFICILLPTDKAITQLCPIQASEKHLLQGLCMMVLLEKRAAKSVNDQFDRQQCNVKKIRIGIFVKNLYIGAVVRRFLFQRHRHYIYLSCRNRLLKAAFGFSVGFAIVCPCE